MTTLETLSLNRTMLELKWGLLTDERPNLHSQSYHVGIEINKYYG